MRWRHETAYGVAAALGIVLALPDDSIDFGGPPPRPMIAEHVSALKTSEASARSSVEVALAPRFEEGTSMDAMRVYGAMDLTLEPYSQDGEFVGYAVLRSHDPRLSVGDVVTAVNGEFVEHSAAGGELLIAMLRNADADIVVRPRSEWASID